MKKLSKKTLSLLAVVLFMYSGLNVEAKNLEEYNACNRYAYHSTLAEALHYGDMDESDIESAYRYYYAICMDLDILTEPAFL